MKLATQILKSILTCPKKTTIFNRINPILFDVSLRDGIQAAARDRYTTDIKKEIVRNIMMEQKFL
jgi:hypothetical protein